MTVLITDPAITDRLKAERQLCGGDRFDEVWEDVYMMAPLPDDEHQDIQAKLTAVFQTAVGWTQFAQVRAGANVSDREAGWEHNYRCPDVAVFLEDTKARNLGTHWVGGPDFAVEIISPYDRTREKLPFYSKLGLRELLVIDRRPWSIELFRHSGGNLDIVGRIDPSGRLQLKSETLGMTFALVPGNPRPSIEIIQAAGQRWIV